MNRFKQYMDIVNEMMVNKDTDFESQKEILKQGYANKKTLNDEASKDIKSEESIAKIKKLLETEHVQNNHFTWNNSGSKYKMSIDQIIDEIKNSEIRPKGKTTTLGPTGKEFKSTLMRIMAKNIVGVDYSASSDDEKKAEEIYANNKDLIDSSFTKLKQGLSNAVKLGETGFYLEKRHGNPNTRFFLKVGKGKITNIINLIPDGKGGFFTSYPGIPPKVIDFSKPAVLLIDNASRIKNKQILDIK